MNMKPRSPWALLLWPAAVIGVVFVIWTTGYLYWQIRISRAVAEIKRAPSKYFVTPQYQNEDLIRIGSRGFPRFLDELEGALARGEADQAAALHCGLSDLMQGSWGDYGKAAAYDDLRLKPSPEQMRADRDEFVGALSQDPDAYPPRWMWWSGTRIIR
jgi:hypothetical protein